MAKFDPNETADYDPREEGINHDDKDTYEGLLNPTEDPEETADYVLAVEDSYAFLDGGTHNEDLEMLEGENVEVEGVLYADFGLSEKSNKEPSSVGEYRIWVTDVVQSLDE